MIAGRKGIAQSNAAPLFFAAIAFSAGIILGRFMWRPPLWWLIAALVFTAAAASALRHSAKIAQWPAPPPIAALGAPTLQGREATADLPTLRGWDNQQVILPGHVVRQGALHPPIHRGDGEQPREQSQGFDLE